MNNLFSDLSWHSEKSLFGKLSTKRDQFAMWLDLNTVKACEASRLSLKKVVKAEDWQLLEKLRIEVEKAFNITDPETIKSFINEIKDIKRTHKANWYIAYKGSVAVGSIGCVEFEQREKSYLRLLDVDILPKFQGQGYGNELMYAVIGLAKKKELEGICLKADTDRWVYRWYEKIGFKTVARWEP